MRAEFAASWIGPMSRFIDRVRAPHYLKGLTVEPSEGGGVELFATQGSIAAWVTDKDGTATERVAFTVPHALVQACRGKGRRLFIHGDDQKLAMRAEVLNQQSSVDGYEWATETLVTKVRASTYAYRHAFQGETTERVDGISFDFELLKVAAAFGVTAARMRFIPSGENGLPKMLFDLTTVLQRENGVTVRVVLMPMRW